MTFKINGNTNITPGSYVSVDVFVEAKKKKLVNQNRYFFVLAEHPDIVWEIPFIVLKKDQKIFVPEIICLPKVPASTTSNYQFLIFNPSANEITFSICPNYEALTINPSSGTILANDYSKILIAGKVPPKPITTSIILNLKNGKSFKIFVQMEPSNQLLHLSSSELIFEDTYIGLKSQKHVFICNKSNECVSFQWANSENIENLESDGKEDEKCIISEFVTIQNKRGCISAMNSVLSIFSFTPLKNFEYDEEEPTFQVDEYAYLYCPILGPQTYRIHISGRVRGPNIEVIPMEISVGSLYMGQARCISFEILNKGPIPGEFYFKNHTDQKQINCLVKPLSTYLNPDVRKSIQLSFYRRDVGKFLTKLNFKIKSGDFLSILLRGISLPPKVKVFPEIFDFGNIPICIPQKGSVEIFNPLPVSIVVEPKIVDDGEENPLILCVDNLNLPINTIINNWKIGEENLKTSCSDFSSVLENSSNRTNITTEISSTFQKDVLDDIPDLATELLKDFKNINSKEQVEIGFQIIDASLDCIFDRCDYFQELRNNKNYLNMDWKALPSDAKEVAIEEERFYLEPNKTRNFPFVLVSNSSGPTTKIVQFRVHPLDAKHSDFKDTVNSSYMINTLRLQYNCMVPILEYNNDISFSQPVYVDMENTFNMNFKNIDIVPGFVYFKVIPSSTSGIVKVEKYQQKFYITPGETIAVACSVIFRKVGKIVLHGIFQLVGKLLEYSFKVEAKVIPPGVQISMDKIFTKQEVLESTRTHLFISNISPTVAQLTFSLKNEKHQFLEPLGASLAPNQKILISIFSKFLDPGLYKNVLYINLKHAESQAIPITFSVEGAPLIFHPNIKHGIDFGTILKNNKLQEDIIEIINLGEKSYKLNIQKNISKKAALFEMPVFNIEPNILKIPPNGQKRVKIQLDISKEVKSEEEFCVDGIMDGRKHRFKLLSFSVRCNIIEPKVLWSKNELRFEMKNPQLNDLEDNAFGLVSIINATPFVANVDLNAQGNFILGEDCENIKEKSLDFIMKGKTSKEIYVSLNEKEIDEPSLMCQCFKGMIKCRANNKTQKSLPLHVKIIGPGLRICTPKVTFFPPYTDSIAHIKVHNCSLMNATYSWKMIDSEILEENASEDASYTKTISELILSMPKEAVPKFPNSIKLECPENFLSDDQESSDEESTSPQRKPSEIDIADLKRKSSLSILKTGVSVASTSSLRSSSSETTFFSPIKCKPLPFSKADKQNFGLDEIFEFLGLSEKTTRLEYSSNVCTDSDLSGGDKKQNNEEHNIKIRFQHKSGHISPKSMFKAYIFLPILPKHKTLVSKYNLNVIGGQPEVLDVTVTSQRGRIRVSKTNINLGKKVWYKTIVDKITITSLSQYPIKITVVDENKLTHQKKHLTGGHVEIISSKNFILQPKTSTEIEFEVGMGLITNFFETIGLEINNNTTAIPIHFHGSGVFPMVKPLSLERISQSLIYITQSYYHLRDLFNDIQRKAIDVYLNTTNDKNKSASSSTLGGVSETKRKRTLKRYQNNGFVLLNYFYEEYPRAEEIERILESEQFLYNLLKSNELREAFDTYSKKYVHLRAMDFDPIIDLKHSICNPIPWKCSAFNLDMTEIRLNETKKFEIAMLFLGPGRLFLSLRSQVPVPGLKASFESTHTNESSNMFACLHQSPDHTFFKLYKNMHERSSGTEMMQTQNTKSKNLHSHSFDFDESGVHQRKRLSNEIKLIKERYTKISQPMKEKKNPFILTEICQTTNENLSELKVKLNLKLTATNEFYEINQIIEDYLFIDVHLGPTIPILLKGKVVPPQTC